MALVDLNFAQFSIDFMGLDQFPEESLQEVAFAILWRKEAEICDKERGLACINDPVGIQEIAAHAAVPVKVAERES